MSDPLSRRDALRTLGLLLGATGLGSAARPAAAADAPHLAETDPTAVALGYHNNASQVDAKQFPTYKSGQECDTCLQLQGQDGQAWRPCNLFPGQLVNAKGWCRVWVPKG
ncbi:MAG TPA: high-potential iron-sulfur protein [Steroidobacteraceae bacterium]|nr:high-potential iron-sulfur protein [Steroidobacteraceae bacterium]